MGRSAPFRTRPLESCSGSLPTACSTACSSTSSKLSSSVTATSIAWAANTQSAFQGIRCVSSEIGSFTSTNDGATSASARIIKQSPSLLLDLNRTASKRRAAAIARPRRCVGGTPPLVRYRHGLFSSLSSVPRAFCTTPVVRSSTASTRTFAVMQTIAPSFALLGVRRALFPS